MNKTAGTESIPELINLIENLMASGNDPGSAKSNRQKSRPDVTPPEVTAPPEVTQPEVAQPEVPPPEVAASQETVTSPSGGVLRNVGPRLASKDVSGKKEARKEKKAKERKEKKNGRTGNGSARADDLVSILWITVSAENVLGAYTYVFDHM
jgi:hypothetical protein